MKEEIAVLSDSGRSALSKNMDTLITLKEIGELLGISRSSVYVLIKSPDFPKPYSLSARCQRWEKLEVEAWLLSKPDIVLYFDPINFGIKRSWEELLEAHAPTDPSFKEWATKKYDADFTLSSIEAASRKLETAPEEFGSLMIRVSELSFRSFE